MKSLVNFLKILYLSFILGLLPQGFNETQSRFPTNQLSRQHSHPFDSAISSSPLTSLGSNPTISSSIARPNIPFPQSLSQLPVVSPHPNMLHPGLAEQLGQQSSLSRLPPHLMAALIEQQLHYQQALQGLPVTTLLNPTSEAPKTSSSIAVSETDVMKSASSSESLPSPSPSTSKPSSPTKSKIWSIADVATGGDSSRTAPKPKVNEESTDSYTNNSTSNEFSNMRMWMDVLQHKIAAGMAGGINPQQLPQLSNPHKSPSILPHSRFPQFQAFTGMVTPHEGAKAAFKETERGLQGE